LKARKFSSRFVIKIMVKIMKVFEKYYDVLKKVPLFEKIPQDGIEKMLGCLGAAVKCYEKDEILLQAGSAVTGIGIVLGGSAQIIKVDVYGRRSIMANIQAGDIFGEVFVCAGLKKSPVAVVAATGTVVMFIGFDRIVTVCPNACGFHTTLIQNMLRLIAGKNLMLNKKIDYLLIKSLRERIAAYLLERSKLIGSAQFDIPFDRSELADYLNAERSALSRELGRMKDEGLIDFYKNSFKLIDVVKLYGLQT
jgi:CRP-like cAMP-binding protein